MNVKVCPFQKRKLRLRCITINEIVNWKHKVLEGVSQSFPCGHEKHKRESHRDKVGSAYKRETENVGLVAFMLAEEQKPKR